MGRIFSFEQVAKRHVPSMPSFDTVTKAVSSLVDANANIKSVVVYGSVATETHTRRSDVDVFVLHTASVREVQTAVKAPLKELTETAWELHVPLNVTFGDLEWAGSLTHTLSWGYVNALKQAIGRGRCYGENPLPSIKIEHLSPRQGLLEYVAHKLGRQNRVACAIIQDPLQELQNALETPVHVARKYVEWLGKPEATQWRTRMLEVCDEHMPWELVKLLDEIQELDRVYDIELELQLDCRNPQVEAYQATLAKLGRAESLCYEYLCGMAAHLASR